MSEYIDEEGKDTVTEGRFLDWPSEGKGAVVDAGVQAIHAWAAASLQKIFQVLGDENRAERCRADLKRLRACKMDYQDSKQVRPFGYQWNGRSGRGQ